jgi:hypothetical protein
MKLLRFRSVNTSLPEGLLTDRKKINIALTRMLGRARRKHIKLVMARLDLQGGAAATPQRLHSFFTDLLATLRICDLCWWDEECGAVLLLLEDVEEPESVIRRVERRARAHGLSVKIQRTDFPQSGVTLAAMLEAVA